MVGTTDRSDGGSDRSTVLKDEEVLLLKKLSRHTYCYRYELAQELDCDYNKLPRFLDSLVNRDLVRYQFSDDRTAQIFLITEQGRQAIGLRPTLPWWGLGAK